MILYTGIAALLLALTHLFAEKLNFTAIPRSSWLSFAGGVSVAYIFMHLLPELAEWQELFKQEGEITSFLRHHTYLIALLGLATFYGLERAAKLSSESERDTDNEEMSHDIRIFWLHISSFALYNAIVGYLLMHREEESLRSLLWFTIAMAFHFLVNDYGLLDHYRHAYRSRGRWLVTLAIIGGWLLGAITELPEVWVSILFAFVAGSTILNVLKEELPEERKSNFWAFSIGALIYSGLLLII
jgi:zinc transporter ZupT